MSELIELFVATYPERLNDLREALRSADRDVGIRAAHALKSVLGNFAARQTFEAAQALEQCLARGDLANAKSVFNQLEPKVKELEADLLSWKAVGQV